MRTIEKIDVIKSCLEFSEEKLNHAFAIAIKSDEVDRLKTIKMMHGFACNIEGKILKLEASK